MLAGAVVPAGAAEPITLPIDTDAAIPVAQHDFDWTGFYAGVFGAVRDSDVAGGQAGLGINAGVNAQLDIVLVGAEVTLQGLSGGAVETAYGEVLGRGGLVLTDDVLLYAAAGYGWDLAGGRLRGAGRRRRRVRHHRRCVAQGGISPRLRFERHGAHRPGEVRRHLPLLTRSLRA